MEPGGASSEKVKTLTNWLDLPRDLTIQIFIKIGIFDLLCSAQFVCSSWRAIARVPRLYCVIDTRDLWKRLGFKHYYLFDKLVRQAMDRSCGQAIQFSFDTPECAKHIILNQLKYKTPRLKCLRLGRNCTVNGDDCMIEVLPKLPLLEEVEFSSGFSKKVIRVLGHSCPKLKSFRLNNDGEYTNPFGRECNKYAFAIAGNMNPCLRSLHLFGNLMNNTGLEAILDRFSQLEYLDLRHCVNLDLNGDLLKRCQGIKTVRLPNDSIEDYHFQVGELFRLTI